MKVKKETGKLNKNETSNKENEENKRKERREKKKRHTEGTRTFKYYKQNSVVTELLAITALTFAFYWPTKEFNIHIQAHTIAKKKKNGGGSKC